MTRLFVRFVQFVLANPVGNVLEKLSQSETLEKLGSDRIYMTVGEAVSAVSSTYKVQV